MKAHILAVLYIILLWLLLIAFLAGLANYFTADQAEAQTYASGIPFEWRVVDGDTISTTARPRKYYRMLGYDAPEITRPKCDAELLQGERAKTHLKGLLSAPNLVWLDTGQRDHYGRALVYIWIGGKALSSLMIASKYGVPYDGKAKFKWCPYLKRNAS